jgi:non-specific protein-tyrosine kinase
MKLRKALEKAKKAREESAIPQKSPSTVNGEQIALDGGETRGFSAALSRSVETVPEDEWQAPVYSKSNKLELDTRVLLNNRCVCITPNAPELDFYKVLRTKIQHLNNQKGGNALLITSAKPGEGKTLTAVNLALTFSKEYNQTILLVDCDLRKQNIHKVLGVDTDAGLIDYLLDAKPLADCIVWPGIEKLTLISGGLPVEQSAELLGSPRMKSLVKEMKSRYDDRHLIFDAPPILSGADTLTLAPLMDGIIIVVEEGRTSMRDLQKAIEQIPLDKFLGFVMNRQKIVKNNYHYQR